MSRLFDALRNGGDGAFVVDEDLRIVFWNRAAEATLGFDSDDAIGQFCYQLGCDEGGHLICKERCQVASLALKYEPVASYDIQVTTKQGDNRWLNVSVITSTLDGNEDKKIIAHLFRDVSQKKKDEMFFRQILETAQRYHKIPIQLDGGRDPHNLIENLTGREREVLILLARGFNTQEIAETLSISRNTARNHIQHILQKLQAHSRLEAVTYALNNGLLT